MFVLLQFQIEMSFGEAEGWQTRLHAVFLEGILFPYLPQEVNLI